MELIKGLEILEFSYAFHATEKIYFYLPLPKNTRICSMVPFQQEDEMLF